MSTDLTAELVEGLAEAREHLAACFQFRDEVGALMIRLVERNDLTGWVLLELIRDLEARTGEFVLSEEENE